VKVAVLNDNQKGVVPALADLGAHHVKTVRGRATLRRRVKAQRGLVNLGHGKLNGLGQRLSHRTNNALVPRTKRRNVATVSDESGEAVTICGTAVAHNLPRRCRGTKLTDIGGGGTDRGKVDPADCWDNVGIGINCHMYLLL